MTIPDTTMELIERFERNRDAYISGSYNEFQLRKEFLDPLFESLGWDMQNKQGYAEAYKDVIHEDAIKVGGFTKAPDYCFRIGGNRKFFVEAKKPSVNLKDDTSPAFQLRRYAWSAKLSLSILSDFEEFAVYDCRVKPVKTDKASTARILYLNYEQYPDKWDELASIFARDAILKGSFDKYVETTKVKKGTAEVDDAFLEEIEAWRDLLARNLALRNSGLSQRELNYAVQTLIDRIIFLRMCEDRGIEEYGRLMALQNGSNVYGRLFELFQRADERYNSGLFHFREEKGRNEAADQLTPTLKVEDKPLKDIIKNLYYPDSPYEFAVLPADILGQVYEQFLGKVIRLTAGHRAVVEDKPEVKKAGGVYYTPTYIVDYIVENTVGKLLEGKTPARVEKLRILDPACGSGSFLITAYQYLLDWHRNWYAANDPGKWAKGKNPRLYQGLGDEWKLTTGERKRILLNNIYGVDVDAQAVEVSKLSLLLKVLEGESDETLSSQLKLFHERALPDLGKNIKCGNSLIGPDFYDNGQMVLINDEERYHINPFDWEVEFPSVMQAGGFDVVIGNPPYIRIQNLKEFAPQEVEYHKQKYVTASKGSYDIYVVFVERGLRLLSTKGQLGFILPSKFLSTDYGSSLRSLLAEATVVDKVVEFGHSQVFPSSTTYTCLLFLNRSRPSKIKYLQISPEELSDASGQQKVIAATALGRDSWLFIDDRSKELLDKLRIRSIPLLELPVKMSRGSSTGDDNVFCLVDNNGQIATREGVPVDIERNILRRPLYATDFSRYVFRPKNRELIIFPYLVSENSYEIIKEHVFREKWPKAYEYLRSNKKRLEGRKQFREWYGYSAPRNLHNHDQADLLVPLLANRGLYAPMARRGETYCVMASAGFSVSLVNHGQQHNKLYVLGLLNSKLLFWNLRQISNKFRAGWITCTKQYVGTLPIRIIDFSEPSDVSRHDRIVELVGDMLKLQSRLTSAKTPDATEATQRQFDAIDSRIDQLVYELYGLDDDEIQVVEKGSNQ